MSMNFANAEPQYDPSALIPAGTIVRGVLHIKPHNLEMGLIATPSKSSDAAYLNCDIVIEGGPYDKKHLFTLIGVAGSEKYTAMGRSAIKAILEYNGAGPSNMAGYEIPGTGRPAPDDVNWMELDGVPVAVKVKIQKGTQQYPDDKNEVAAFLTPIDPSIKKDWDRFTSGDLYPAAQAAPAQAAASAAPVWQTQQAPSQPATNVATGQPLGELAVQAQAPARAPATSTPSWLTAGAAQASPPDGAADENIPF